MPSVVTAEKSSRSRAAPTWCSSTRQILVSCSRVISATFATGIAAAKVNASASNSIENPDWTQVPLILTALATGW